jgi:hypothetical protein
VVTGWWCVEREVEEEGVRGGIDYWDGRLGRLIVGSVGEWEMGLGRSRGKGKALGYKLQSSKLRC